MTAALVGIIIVQGYWLNSAIELEEQQFHKSVLHAMSVSAQRLEGEERISQSKLSRGGMTTFSIKTHTTIDTNFNARKYSFEFEEEN